MSKKELTIPLIVLGVALAFALVSLGVWATRGNSPTLVKRKLALGAMLLSLTSMASDCGPGPFVSCYEPVEDPNSTYIDGSSGRELTVDLNEGNLVSGHFYNCEGAAFSFLVANTTGFEVQRGELTPADGIFGDSYDEDFEFELSPELTAGEYSLHIFAVASVEIDASRNNSVAEYDLHLISE